MNKHRYRIIFNQVRCMLMVVAETATSLGKATGETSGSAAVKPIGLGLVGALRPLAFSLMLVWGAVSILPIAAQAAGVVADSAAPANQRPTILNATNGVPLVNIQTPSAAGVSRNTYSQFDVTNQGVILNNSRVNTQTQLGGWVQGNPYLATGTARVILNEVNSNNPSLLNGYVEVAGSRAQVVIGNTSKDSQVVVSYFGNDPVPTKAGGNEGFSTLRDLWTVLTGPDNTQHSCYGTGALGCAQVEIPLPRGQGNPGTAAGNGSLYRYENGTLVTNPAELN